MNQVVDMIPAEARSEEEQFISAIRTGGIRVEIHDQGRNQYYVNGGELNIHQGVEIQYYSMHCSCHRPGSASIPPPTATIQNLSTLISMTRNEVAELTQLIIGERSIDPILRSIAPSDTAGGTPNESFVSCLSAFQATIANESASKFPSLFERGPAESITTVHTAPQQFAITGDIIFCSCQQCSQHLNPYSHIFTVSSSQSSSSAVLTTSTGGTEALKTARRIAFYNRNRTANESVGTIIPFVRTKISRQNYPAPSEMYIRRKMIEDHMSSFFDSNSTEGRKCLVLHGLGGSGKSQLTSFFIHKNFYNLGALYRRFSYVCWLDATSDESIRESLESFAQSADIGSTAQESLDWLASRKKRARNWIIVFDGANDPALDLARYFPSCSHGNMVITTRNEHARRYGSGPRSTYHVSGMTDTEAVDLLLKHAVRGAASSSRLERLRSSFSYFQKQQSYPWDKQDAAALVNILCCFPLSVAQAGAYISTAPSMLKGYVHMHRNLPKQLDEEMRGIENKDGYHRSIQESWSSSYETLSDQSRHLLHLVAYLDCSEIKKDIFENLHGLEAYEDRYKSFLTSEERNAIAALKNLRQTLSTNDCFDFGKLLGLCWELRSHSLISLLLEKEAISVHPLVHMWSKHMGSAATQATFHLQASLLLSSAILNRRSSNSRNIEYLRTLTSHVYQVANGAAVVLDGCRNEFAHVYECVERWNEVVAHREGYNDACVRILGTEHWDTVASMESLATSYRKQGRTADAVTLEIQMTQTLAAFHSLFLSKIHQQRYGEAAKLGIQILERRRRLLGETDLATLESMHELGHVYHCLGRLEEAVRLELEAVEGRKAKLGRDHLDTLGSMHNLGKTYHSLRRFEEARDIQLKALEGLKEKLGEDHLQTLSSMSGLGSTCWALGRFEEAKDLQLKVVDGQKEKLGEDHLDTLLSMHNLGVTYQSLDRFEDAEKFQSQALEGQKRRLGEDDLHTLVYTYCLGKTLIALGKLAEAETICQQALPASRRLRGPEHERTRDLERQLEEIRKQKGKTNDTSDLGSRP